jgi:hypothetical protein
LSLAFFVVLPYKQRVIGSNPLAPTKKADFCTEIGFFVALSSFMVCGFCRFVACFVAVCRKLDNRIDNTDVRYSKLILTIPYDINY